jgi:hypothetical protein
MPGKKGSEWGVTTPRKQITISQDMFDDIIKCKLDKETIKDFVESALKNEIDLRKKYFKNDS